MVKISVSGGRGTMGRLICRAIEENREATLSGILEAPGHKDEGKEFFSAVVETDPVKVAGKCDVIIDFSAPEATMKVLHSVRSEGKALVVGTTGLNKSRKNELKTYASQIPVLFSPNMSVGVNVLFKAVAGINRALKDMGYDREIIEAHHKRKVDSPSGTASKLFEIISEDTDKQINGRRGQAGPREESEIGVHAVRGGNIVGEHTLMWIGPEDRIELTHRASSRMIFASGAVRAAIWLSKASPGRLYGMEDVLG